VFEYVDTVCTELALKALDGLALLDQKLSAQRVPSNMVSVLLPPSCIVSESFYSDSKKGNAAGGGGVDSLENYPPSTVIRLGNMAAIEDILDDELYEELQEDVADECNKHGTVRTVVIPKPVAGSTVGTGGDAASLGPGVGYVFVSFTTSEGAGKARGAIAGRKFNGKTVEAVFYPEDLFQNKVSVIAIDLHVFYAFYSVIFRVRNRTNHFDNLDVIFQ